MAELAEVALTERQVASRYGVNESDVANGRTFAAAAAARGHVWEMELPAGTVIELGGKKAVLQGAVTVRASDPCMAIEGVQPPATGEAWAVGVPMRLVPPVEVEHRRVALAYVPKVDAKAEPERFPVYTWHRNPSGAWADVPVMPHGSVREPGPDDVWRLPDGRRVQPVRA